jgi:hypothetical protein
VWAQQAIEAMQSGVVLRLTYSGGYTRDVEVHAVGVSLSGQEVMRCWQLRGDGGPVEAPGWTFARLDEPRMVTRTGEKSKAPRAGYKRGDRALRRVIAQI